jgi:hypothetical protein
VISHPDIDLTELYFEHLLEPSKKLPILFCVRDIHKCPYQIIAIELALVFPVSVNRMRFTRDGPESLLDFD